MEGQEDRKEKPLRAFFSRIKQRVEPLDYFLRLLGLLLKYGALIDACESSQREIVWKHIIDLYNLNVQPTDELFAPVLARWRNSQLMDLEAIELYYLGFSNALLEHPNLLDSNVLPFPTPSRIPPIPPGFNMVWGSGVVAQLQQLSLLLNWAPRLDKLAPKHKEIIWRQCEMFNSFTPDDFDRNSFKETLNSWVQPPVKSLQLATIMFIAVGHLCECGLIKYRFCYPNTLTSVFSKQPSKARFNREEYPIVIRDGVDAVPHPESDLFRLKQEPPKEPPLVSLSEELALSSNSHAGPSGSS